MRTDRIDGPTKHMMPGLVVLQTLFVLVLVLASGDRASERDKPANGRGGGEIC
jgi:hypothetical protein